jgi:hypothetical protein
LKKLDSGDCSPCNAFSEHISMFDTDLSFAKVILISGFAAFLFLSFFHQFSIYTQMHKFS